jgi:hypothetical protein
VRRTLSILVAVVATFAIAGTALAVAPTWTSSSGGLNFHGTPDATVSSSGALTVKADVSGAGTTATANLTATRTVVTGCANRGSKNQEPSGLERTSGAVSAGPVTLNTRAGRASFDLTIPAPTLNRECPDRMTAVLVSVEYTDITLSITSAPNKTATAFWSGPITN